MTNPNHPLPLWNNNTPFCTSIISDHSKAPIVWRVMMYVFVWFAGEICERKKEKMRNENKFLERFLRKTIHNWVESQLEGSVYKRKSWQKKTDLICFCYEYRKIKSSWLYFNFIIQIRFGMILPYNRYILKYRNAGLDFIL